MKTSEWLSMSRATNMSIMLVFLLISSLVCQPPPDLNQPAQTGKPKR